MWPSAGARQQTVISSRVGPVHLWTVVLHGTLTASAELLSAEERRSAARYVRNGDRDRFIARRSVRREILARYAGEAPARLGFDATCRHCGDPGHGRPRVAGRDDLEFSASSAWIAHRDVYLVVLGVTRGVPVGVDVTADHAVRWLAPETYLTHAEQRLDGVDPTAAWTAKEAVLKLLGTGLALDPRRLQVVPEVRLPRAFGATRVQVDVQRRGADGAGIAVAWADACRSSAVA
jgi:4'-phosphopantetheinyl transferase